ncbi:MAG: helix-turn-helix transcriptional regulator [Myxococcota bacterium]
MRQPTPAGIRHRVLETVRSQADADAAALLRVVEVGDDLYCAAVDGSGASDLCSRFSSEVDRPLAAIPGLDLHNPPTAVCRSLSRLRCVGDRAGRPCLPPVGAVADAASDVAHLLLYHGRDLVGWLLLARRAGRERFTARELNGAPPPVSAMAAAVDQAFRVEPRPFDGAEAPVILTPRGEVEYASAVARPWLTPARREAVARVLSVVREPVPGEQLYVTEGVRIALRELEWNGRAAFLGLLEVAAPPRVRPDAALSSTQRTVARYAAAGATTPEIARSMGRSVETIRSHMKEIYRRLGVTSRLELVRCLGDERGRS